MENPGGGQALILRLIRGSDPDRFEHSIYLVGPLARCDHEYDLSGIPVVRFCLPKRSALDPFLYRIFNRLRLLVAQIKCFWTIKRDKIDIVHIHAQIFRCYLPLQLMAWCAGLGVMRTSHSTAGEKGVRRRFSARLTGTTCHVWTAVGGDGAEQLKIMAEIGDDKIKVVANGINADAFGQHQRKNRQVYRRLLGTDRDEFLILWVGRLIGIKDALTAVRAFALARQSMKSARLIIAGDGSERAKLEGEIKRLGIVKWVRLLGSRSDIPQLLSAADLFVISSTAEGMPTSVAEAMLSGVAVLGTDIPGVRYACDYGRAGMLVPPKSPEKMAEAMVELAFKPEKRKAIANTGYLRAKELFTVNKMVERYEELYMKTSPRKITFSN